eukprot:CAMPEP_0195515928 /NCGR_PEP_ID=MMETSP0794_2-20130614/6823_1 /TAXON_ID=515487 /ORGANISM="Stephanopyxis turris, Strain CCMP 815" /LENGTH=543 /DNA_ID=CAMNT_0040644429 /DNA_START=44 /DNA_END=1675 /DNA_ORIENTATION=-
MTNKVPPYSPTDYGDTPVASIGPLVERLRKTAESRIAHDLSWRKSQLNAMSNMLKVHREDIRSAYFADLGQNEFFADTVEIAEIQSEIKFALQNLSAWTSPERVPTPFPTNLLFPVHSEIRAQPRGLALIFVPWNYPLGLALRPLVGAIAAGNCVVVKPSEISKNISALLCYLIGKYLDNDAIAVVMGGTPQSPEVLKFRFDAICFTGSTRVGKLVARAASEHLTPCLLELGGKSPAIVCSDADVPSAALRIAWGKWTMNMGQTCVTPDYVLVVEELKEKFVKELKRVLIEYYGTNPKDSKDVGRMISKSRTEHVANMLDDATIHRLHGGKTVCLDERYLEPTIVEATPDSKCMQEEIFGPILPILSVQDVRSAIEYLNARYSSVGAHPLSLYIFSQSKQTQNLILSRVPAGSVAINGTIFQLSNIHLPFGGVGESGMGSYHGKFGFDFFSHRLPVLNIRNVSSNRLDPGVWMTCPPYTRRKGDAMAAMHAMYAQLDWIRFVGKWIVAPILVAVFLFRNPGFLEEVKDFNINKGITILGGWMG